MLPVLTLRMTLLSDDNEVPYSPASLERVTEIVREILIGTNTEYVDIAHNGDLLYVIVNTKQDIATITEELHEWFGDTAGDTWMEGDISIDDDHELNLTLLDIKQLVTTEQILTAPLEQLQAIMVAAGYNQQMDIASARLTVMNIYYTCNMLYAL